MNKSAGLYMLNYILLPNILIVLVLLEEKKMTMLLISSHGLNKDIGIYKYHLKLLITVVLFDLIRDCIENLCPLCTKS